MLVDGFGRIHNYLRLSVTDRCNLRCVYCMPSSGFHWKPRAEILTLEEMLRLARLLVCLGIEKIRLTGGEPTVRQNIEWLVERLSALSGLKTLSMTTNGLLLKTKIRALREAGLHSVNVSLDTLRRDRFRAITLRDRFDDAMDGIMTALDAGFTPVKINVVVMAGINDDELADFTEFARTNPVNVRFIEFMPFPGNPWQRERYVPWRVMKQIVERTQPLVPAFSDTEHLVSRDFRMEGARGTISFISPLSEEFCGGCNRLRLTADGAIKSCLLHPAEISLRDHLRAGACDDELATMILAALPGKSFTHPPECVLPELDNRCMTAIGG